MTAEEPRAKPAICPKCGGRMAEYKACWTCVRCFESLYKPEPVGVR
jgi:ribosomal protein S27AE